MNFRAPGWESSGLATTSAALLSVVSPKAAIPKATNKLALLRCEGPAAPGFRFVDRWRCRLQGAAPIPPQLIPSGPELMPHWHLRIASQFLPDRTAAQSRFPGPIRCARERKSLRH